MSLVRLWNSLLEDVSIEMDAVVRVHRSYLTSTVRDSGNVASGRIVPAIPIRTGSHQRQRGRPASAGPFSLRGDVPMQEAPFPPFEFVPTEVPIAEEEVDFGNTLLRFIEAE